jgi:hypothetical protein
LRSGLKDKIGTEPSAKGKDDELVLMETGLPGGQGTSFSKLNNSFATLLNIMQDADVAPTSQVIKAVNEAQSNLKWLMNKLAQFKM